jgi:hypothetical protein
MLLPEACSLISWLGTCERVRKNRLKKNLKSYLLHGLDKRFSADPSLRTLGTGALHAFLISLNYISNRFFFFLAP